MTSRSWAWLVPFAYGALLALAGLAWIITGEPFDKATYERIAGQDWPALAKGPARILPAVIRLQGGNSALLAGLLVMALAALPLRRGEAWAWWTLLALPLHALLDLLLVTAHGGLGPAALAWDGGLLVALLLGAALIRPTPGRPSTTRRHRRARGAE